MTASLWSPPPLPGIGRSSAVWNAILSYTGVDLALLNGAYCRFELTEEPADFLTCTELLFPNKKKAFVIWHHFPFNSLFNVLLDVKDFSTLPPALRDALDEGMLDFVRRSLPSDQLDDISTIRSINLKEAEGFGEETLAWFKVTFEGLASEPIILTFGCKREEFLLIAENMSFPTATVNSKAREEITVSATFTLGSLLLSAQALQSLRAGTVILLPAAPQEKRLLRIGKALWVFHPTSKGWTLAGTQERLLEKAQRCRLRNNKVIDEINLDSEDDTEITMLPPREFNISLETEYSQEEEAPDQDIQLHGTEEEFYFDQNLALTDASDQNSFNVDDEDNEEFLLLNEEGINLLDLPINVDFDIGERDFSLAEIETWQPGAVVELDPPVFSGQVEVALRTNGKIIAMGDLISIDERLAIRLSKVLLRS